MKFSVNLKSDRLAEKVVGRLSLPSLSFSSRLNVNASVKLFGGFGFRLSVSDRGWDV